MGQDAVDHLRKGNAMQFRCFPDDAGERHGCASGEDVTVRALLYILAGHARHHIGVIRERYI